MKNFLLFIFVFLFFQASAFSVDSGWGDNSDVFTKGFEDQKAVSDSKMKNAVKVLKDWNLSNKQKRMRRDVKPLSPKYDSDYLKSFTDTNTSDDDFKKTMTVMIPMPSYGEDGTYIAPGYYKLSCRRVSEDLYVLDLSQGTKVVLTVPAVQTQQDLEQDTISFCNAEILDKGRIRLMYGSIDLNLVGYIYFK